MPSPSSLLDGQRRCFTRPFMHLERYTPGQQAPVKCWHKDLVSLRHDPFISPPMQGGAGAQRRALGATAAATGAKGCISQAGQPTRRCRAIPAAVL